MGSAYDVAIVGFGPVGAILANVLGKAGHSVLVLDKAADIYDKPRAINIDHEVMRVLQSIGLANETLKGTVQHPGTDFLGAEGETIKTFEPPTAPFPLYWPPNLMFVQPEFEPVIRAGAQRYAAVDVRRSTECIGLEDDGSEVRLALLAGGVAETVRASYVVACDGATSFVRKQLGIHHESLDFDEYWTVVDAWLLHDTPLPRRTTQYCRPDGPATYVVGPRNLRRWELKLLPGETPDDFADMGYLRQRMSAYVDVDALDLWRVATYRFHALIAKQWQKGRVFLAGDAAHQMPPFMAQGLCSGVRDVANLGWKLSGVLNANYMPSLLTTYEEERKPHIRTLTETTKRIGEIIGELDADAAARRDVTMLAQMRSGQTVSLRQALIPNLTTGLLGRSPGGGLAIRAGELFPQPQVRNLTHESCLLDDIVGERFLVLTSGEIVPTAPFGRLSSSVAVHLRLAAATGPFQSGSDLAELNGTLLNWMLQSRLQAVIVRPDRYVFGAAQSQAEFTALIEQLLAEIPFELQPSDVAIS